MVGEREFLIWLRRLLPAAKASLVILKLVDKIGSPTSCVRSQHPLGVDPALSGSRRTLADIKHLPSSSGSRGPRTSTPCRARAAGRRTGYVLHWIYLTLDMKKQHVL